MKNIFLSFFVLMWAGVQAQTLKIANVKVAAGATGFFYLEGGSMTNPLGIDIVLKYDPKVWTIGAPSLDGGVLEGKNYGIEANLGVAGEARIGVLAKGTPVSPTGNLVKIPYTAIGAPGAVSALTITAFKVNEKDYIANVTNGTFTIEGATAQTPDSPTNFKGTPIGARSISLSWVGKINNTELQGRAKGGTYVTLIQPQIMESATNGVSPSTDYEYRIRAVNSAGLTSAWVEISVRSGDLPKPTGLKAVAKSQTEITVTWDAVAGSEQNRLEYSENGINWLVLPSTGVLPLVTFPHTGLKPGTEYSYRLRGEAAGIFSVYSDVAKAFTTAAVNACSLDPAKFEFAGRFSGNDFYFYKGGKVNWAQAKDIAKTANASLPSPQSKAQNDYLFGLKTKYAPTEDIWIGFTDEIKEGEWRDASGNIQTYFNWDASAPNNLGGLEHYCSMWRNVGEWNDLPASGYNIALIVTLPTCTLSLPTNLKATALSKSEIKLDWVSPEPVDIESKEAGGAFAPLATNITANTYPHQALKASIQYFYRIRASKNGVFSDWVEANATTLAETETPPFTLTTGGEGVHSIISPANLNLLSDINGLKLLVGDWIAVAAMDAAGKPTIITDAKKFDGTDLSLKALGNNTDFSATKKGFAANEKITFLVYQASSKLIFEVVAEFEPTTTTGSPVISHTGNFGGDGATSKLKSLKTCVTQIIHLKKGHNFVGHWVMPYLKALGVAYKSANNITIRNAKGNSVLVIGEGTVLIPSDLDSMEGYKIFVPADTKIEICGKKILPQSVFSLKGNLTYSTYLPYLGENTTDLAVDLDALVVSKSFSVAQIMINEGVNAAGDPIYKAYDFIPGTSINEIDQILKGVSAGMAIKIKMIKDASYVYTPNVKRTTKTDYVKAGADAEYFKFQATVPENMSVIVDLPQGTKIGDEIAVYIGGKLCGSVKIENEKQALIHVHSLENGKELSFKYFDSFTGKEKPFTASKAVAYRADALVTMNETVLGVSTVEMPIGTMIFPNPTSGLVKAYWPSANGETFQAVVYDALGKATSAVQSVSTDGSQNEAVINLENYSKGIYILKVSGQHSGAWTARIVKE